MPTTVPLDPAVPAATTSLERGLAEKIDEGLCRASRPIFLPREILRCVCESLMWVVVGRGRDTVTADAALDQERLLSPLERKLVAIFFGSGPTLTFTQAVQLGRLEGLNPSTVGHHLSRAPVVQTLARGRYALRGQPGALGWQVAA
jgi:hypothetical protein